MEKGIQKESVLPRLGITEKSTSFIHDGKAGLLEIPVGVVCKNAATTCSEMLLCDLCASCHMCRCVTFDKAEAAKSSKRSKRSKRIAWM